MKVFKIEDLSYNGVHEGVHRWDVPDGQPYYWHPDWVHVAEDAVGLYPKQPLEVDDDEVATEEHAKDAIVKHLNDKD